MRKKIIENVVCFDSDDDLINMQLAFAAIGLHAAAHAHNVVAVESALQFSEVLPHLCFYRTRTVGERELEPGPFAVGRSLDSLVTNQKKRRYHLTIPKFRNEGGLHGLPSSSSAAVALGVFFFFSSFAFSELNGTSVITELPATAPVSM